jgi:hypothetical protein
MFNPSSVVIDSFSKHVLEQFRRMYTDPNPAQLQSLEQAVNTALETLLNCDCPYHDMNHTILVTDVGLSILQGRQVARGDLSSHDWLQAVVAMLFHDIGYIRQLLAEDSAEQSAIDPNGKFIKPPMGASDAYMTPYHVTRGTMFVQSRFANDPCIDTQVVMDCIEMTRFPVPADPAYQHTDSLPGLVRAADLIGQMADPEYRQKLSRLFAEFSETGEADRLGVRNPGELRDGFPEFFYSQVQPYVGSGIEYLKRTQEGRGWIASLFHRLQTNLDAPNLDPSRRAPELVIDNT